MTEAEAAAIPDATGDVLSDTERPFHYKGMQQGETFGMAAERWAQWCERRSLSMLPDFLRYAAEQQTRYSDHACICRGNWRAIVKETEHLLDKPFIDSRDGARYVFFGIVHGSDDYYYGMVRKGQHMLLSCVGSIEGHGFVREGSSPEGRASEGPSAEGIEPGPQDAPTPSSGISAPAAQEVPADARDAALKRISWHWDEFGPGHGFEEVIDACRAAMAAPTPQEQKP